MAAPRPTTPEPAFPAQNGLGRASRRILYDDFPERGDKSQQEYDDEIEEWCEYWKDKPDDQRHRIRVRINDNLASLEPKVRLRALLFDEPGNFIADTQHRIMTDRRFLELVIEAFEQSDDILIEAVGTESVLGIVKSMVILNNREREFAFMSKINRRIGKYTEEITSGLIEVRILDLYNKGSREAVAEYARFIARDPDLKFHAKLLIYSHDKKRDLPKEYLDMLKKEIEPQFKSMTNP